MKRDQLPVKRPGRELNQDRQRLKRRRIAAGLSIKDLADLARCSVPYLWQLENGDYSASPRMLGALANALRCKVTDLMPRDVLSRAQRGQYADNARMLSAIADAIGCEISDLMPPETDGAERLTILTEDPRYGNAPKQGAA